MFAEDQPHLSDCKQWVEYCQQVVHGTQAQIPPACRPAWGSSQADINEALYESCNFLPKQLWLFSWNDRELEPVSASPGSAPQNLRLSPVTTTAYAAELSGTYIIGLQHENPGQTAVSLHFCPTHTETKAWPILIVAKPVMNSRELC